MGQAVITAEVKKVESAAETLARIAVSGLE